MFAHVTTREEAQSHGHFPNPESCYKAFKSYIQIRETGWQVKTTAQVAKAVKKKITEKEFDDHKQLLIKI